MWGKPPPRQSLAPCHSERNEVESKNLGQVFAYPLCGDTPQRPFNNPSLKGTVACKKDRQSQLHFVRRYPPDFLPSNYALSPRKWGSLRRRLLDHGVPSQPHSCHTIKKPEVLGTSGFLLRTVQTLLQIIRRPLCNGLTSSHTSNRFLNVTCRHRDQNTHILQMWH